MILHGVHVEIPDSQDRKRNGFGGIQAKVFLSPSPHSHLQAEALTGSSTNILGLARKLALDAQQFFPVLPSPTAMQWLS